jgi:hypothetical protein
LWVDFTVLIFSLTNHPFVAVSLGSIPSQGWAGPEGPKQPPTIPSSRTRIYAVPY